MTAVAMGPQAHLIATASRAGSFELIRADAPDQRRRFRGLSRVESMAFSPDGTLLAAASENGVLDLYSTSSLTRIASLRDVLLGFHSVAFSPDGARLAAGSNGREAVKLWSGDSFDDVATLAGQGSFFTDLAFSPDGNTIGARNWGGTIHLWSAPSWTQVSR
jgi:WD40 repeat protein